MRLIVTDSEYSTVNLGMQRLDPAVEHLWKSRVIRNLRYFDTRITKRFGCATGREHMHVKFSQPFAEFGQPRFVRNAQERAAHRKHPLLLFCFEKT